MTGWDGHCHQILERNESQDRHKHKSGPMAARDRTRRLLRHALVERRGRWPYYPVVIHVSLQWRPEGTVRVTRGKVRVHPAACVWLVFSPPSPATLDASIPRISSPIAATEPRADGSIGSPTSCPLRWALSRCIRCKNEAKRQGNLTRGRGTPRLGIRRPGRRIGPTAARIRELWWGCMAGWGMHAWMHVRWCRCFGSSVRPFGVARGRGLDWWPKRYLGASISHQSGINLSSKIV